MTDQEGGAPISCGCGRAKHFHVKADSDRYLKLFEDGLIVDQVKAIGELIMAHMPDPEDAVDAVGEAPLVC
jgi:hypothetical protein